jgi:hypothetical protein
MKWDYSLLGCDAVYYRVQQQKVIYSYLNNYNKKHVGQSENPGFESYQGRIGFCS